MGCRLAHTFLGTLECENQAGPSVGDTGSKGHNVIQHVKGDVIGNRNVVGLLKDSSDDRDISFEMLSNAGGNVAKGFQNWGLQRVGKLIRL
jgi:hypothetical protein